MSIVSEPTRRRRRTAEESREEALAAAQRLLIEGGPEAVTLQAVAAALGMTHANLIHRFGSAAGLQSGLMAKMVEDLSETIRQAADRWRTAGGTPSDLVEPVFHAFRNAGGAQLAARIALSGSREDLAPIAVALNELTRDLTDAEPAPQDARKLVARWSLMIVLMAFGDALIGDPLRAMLGSPQDEAVTLTAEMVRLLLEERMKTAQDPTGD